MGIAVGAETTTTRAVGVGVEVVELPRCKHE